MCTLKLLLSFLKTSRTRFLLPFSDSPGLVCPSSVPGTVEGHCRQSSSKKPKGLAQGTHSMEEGRRPEPGDFPTLIFGLRTSGGCSGNADEGQLFCGGKTWECLKVKKAQEGT